MTPEVTCTCLACLTPGEPLEWLDSVTHTLYGPTHQSFKEMQDQVAKILASCKKEVLQRHPPLTPAQLQVVKNPAHLRALRNLGDDCSPHSIALLFGTGLIQLAETGDPVSLYRLERTPAGERAVREHHDDRRV